MNGYQNSKLVQRLFEMRDADNDRFPDSEILYRIQPDGSRSIATMEDVDKAIIESTRVPHHVVERHHDKLRSILVNIAPQHQQKFGNLLTGAALNFLTDEEFEECVRAAQLTLAADGMLQ